MNIQIPELSFTTTVTTLVVNVAMDDVAKYFADTAAFLLANSGQLRTLKEILVLIPIPT